MRTSIRQLSAYFAERGIDVLGCARGRSGACHLIGSNRGNWDHGDKECRTFFGARLHDPGAEWVSFKFSVSRSALASGRVRRLLVDREAFLLRAGLQRFRKLLLEDDTPGRSDEFMLHSRSADDEFAMPHAGEMQAEVSRVQRETLELLWQNRHSGVKRTDKEALRTAVCTVDAILDPVLSSFEARKLIHGAHRDSGMKITSDGEVELDRLRAAARGASSAVGAPLPPTTQSGAPYRYDVFISHASEDKGLVRPLAESLRAAGIRVWYDEFELTWGASLRESIDKGLAGSRYGLVILSHRFFAKEWPQRELNGLFATMNAGRRILPIWHEVGAEEIQKYSPMLADLLAIKSSEGVDAIVAKVLAACVGNQRPGGLDG